MTTLTTVRAELAAALKGTDEQPALGIPTYDYLPARITPPVGVVLPEQPYLTSGSTFGSFDVRLAAVLVVGAVNNKTATTTLDGIITTAVIAATNAGFLVREVSKPYAYDTGGAKYLAIDLIVTKSIHL